MRTLSRFVMALVALGLAFPAMASAAQVAAKAVATCAHCPFGCC
jgi:hypothetical protein